MSTTSSVSVRFVKPVHSLAPIVALLNSGWTYRYHGEILYLPLNDKGMYDWQYAPLEEWQHVLALLQTKCDQCETIGLGMSSDNEGATFCFRDGIHLDVILDADRKRLIEGQPFTDFGGYLRKIVGPLIAAKFHIESVECSDYT